MARTNSGDSSRFTVGDWVRAKNPRTREQDPHSPRSYEGTITAIAGTILVLDGSRQVDASDVVSHVPASVNRGMALKVVPHTIGTSVDYRITAWVFAPTAAEAERIAVSFGRGRVDDVSTLELANGQRIGQAIVHDEIGTSKLGSWVSGATSFVSRSGEPSTRAEFIAEIKKKPADWPKRLGALWKEHVAELGEESFMKDRPSVWKPAKRAARNNPGNQLSAEDAAEAAAITRKLAKNAAEIERLERSLSAHDYSPAYRIETEGTIERLRDVRRVLLGELADIHGARANPKRRAKSSKRKNLMAEAIAGGAAAGVAGAATSKALEKRNNPRIIERADGKPIVEVTGACFGSVDWTQITIVRANGERYRPNGTPKGINKITRLGIDRVEWLPLRRRGKWNGNVRKLLRGKAGVYAISKDGGATTLYVGEGGKHGHSKRHHSKDPDRLMRTLLRHFQAGFSPERYGKSPEWTYHGREDLDVALWIAKPSVAYEREGQVILELEPRDQTGANFEDATFDVDDLEPKRKAA